LDSMIAQDEYWEKQEKKYAWTNWWTLRN
jgi:hypothetical protein